MVTEGGESVGSEGKIRGEEGELGQSIHVSGRIKPHRLGHMRISIGWFFFNKKKQSREKKKQKSLLAVESKNKSMLFLRKSRRAEHNTNTLGK